MKRLIDGLAIDSKRAIKPKPAIYHGLDSHKWATKMEIQRLLSGKPDLKIKFTPRDPALREPKKPISIHAELLIHPILIQNRVSRIEPSRLA